MTTRKPRSSRRRLGGVAVGVGLVLAVVLGPRVRFEVEWREAAPTDDLDRWIASEEGGIPEIRTGDARGIVWHDAESRARTPISIVYLHGFSADRHEIEPVVSDLARTFGANVYFTRLMGHGRDGPAMAEATVEGWLSDAAEAVGVGGRIGDTVVLIGTSTGGTLATWAATREEAQDRLGAVVLLSPNYRPANRQARIMLLPWGALVARLVAGKERCFIAENDEQARHWTTCYPISAIATMMGLVEFVRTLDVSGITTPTLVVYSTDDQVVDPTETERVVERMPPAIVTQLTDLRSADPSGHVPAGDILSPASNDAVHDAIADFLRVVLTQEDVGAR
ncbi:MAG: alpha/beta hydrolase [Longimicrobiales bacterium]|jgi:pimeloyl-ACP methyl ester carboxylesterase